MSQIDSLGLILNDEYLEFLIQKFEESEFNRLPEEFGSGKIFSKPLIGVAQGNDPIFQKYKEIIGSEHLTPLELWLATGQKYIPVERVKLVLKLKRWSYLLRFTLLPETLAIFLNEKLSRTQSNISEIKDIMLYLVCLVMLIRL